MRENTWQCVGVQGDLQRIGDFITCEVLGVPIVVRLFQNELVALSNVCAHRHSLIRSEAKGNHPELSCQYHGWCYGSDGLTRRIPCAKDFAPIDREALKLPVYRCETIGQLVFVSLGTHVPPLRSYLGPMVAILEARCGSDMHVNLNAAYEYGANWKVAIENTLEAYHIQSVHPTTFGTEPGEARCEHRFYESCSTFTTDLPFEAENKRDVFFQKFQGRVMRFLGRSVNAKYQHCHAYPNLLVSFTDAITLVQSVVPLAENRSRSNVIQFGFVPQKSSFMKKLIAKNWAKLETSVIKRILAEDYQILPKIQSGLQASPHEGVLGRAEERIASFQDYWCDVMKMKSEEVLELRNIVQ
jgi:phenylpropionate dioxygenase-like ring-hydroxylating dioxygenase large terminal subunit